MQISTVSRTPSLCFIIGAVFGFSCLTMTPVVAQTTMPPDVKPNCTVSANDFQGWITLNSINLPGIPKPVGPVYDTTSGLVYVFPPEGPDFPANGSDCEFYKWGSQMFLWLTSTVTDTATPPPAPVPPDSATDFVFASEFFYEVQTDANGDMHLSSQGGDSKSSAPLGIRVNKPMLKKDGTPLNAESTGQAGGDGVLISQSANNISKESSLVYYGIATNRVYGYFLNLAGPKTTDIFPDDGLQTCVTILHGLLGGYAKLDETSILLFLNYCTPHLTAPEHLAAIDELKAKAENSGLDLSSAPTPGATGNIIPSLETAVDYLSMAVELKTSWVKSDSLQHPERYIRRTADIYDFTQTSEKLWERSSTVSKDVDLALVGMHVVGTVNGHPEMVWATIEHVDNTPNVGYRYLNDSDGVSFTSETSTSPSDDWLFSDGTPTTFIDERARVVTKAPPKGPAKIGDIAAKSGKTIGPVNVNRLVPWGNPMSEDSEQEPSVEANRNAQLISMNASVIGNLQNLLPGDPRANYFVSGATWTQLGKIPVFGTETFITGSTLLANTTMETFHQELNCFSCHSRFIESGDTPYPPADISHIFSSLKPDLPPAE